MATTGDGEHKRTLDRLKKLIEAQGEHQSKANAIGDEIAAILRGDPAMGDKLKACEQAFSDHWASEHLTPYRFNHKVDTPNLKRLIKTFGVEEVTRRIAAFFVRADDYTRKAKHPFGLFVHQWNSLAATAPTGELTLAAPVSDCRHDPPCQSDQEHTRRRQADLRAGRA